MNSAENRPSVTGPAPALMSQVERQDDLTIGSLCSGYGGLEEGLHAVIGGTVSWHAEIDPHPAKVLAVRYPGVPNLGDLATTDWTQVPRVDWMTAGYPCQPDSLAGKGLSEDDERWIWPDIARAIGVLRPRHLLLENVSGHFVRGFRTVLGSLASLGYDATWTLVRASDVGAPHRRERLFVIASNAAQCGRRGAAGLERGLGTTGCVATAVADAGGQGRRVEGRAVGGRAPGPGSPGGPARSSEGPAADADRAGSEALSGRSGSRDVRRFQSVECGGAGVEWGAYGPAIRRWERVTGRAVPCPTTDNGRGGRRLNPRLNEWMMGLPDGWVTDILPRSPALKCLGNGVVPQQAALAVRTLLSLEAVAA